jgi:four helix bundle protein
MKFRTYNLAVDLAREVDLVIQSGRLKGPKRDQLERAALSIPLNLIEGASRTSEKERKRFYNIALGSLREVQCLIELARLTELEEQADKLGAHLYKLSRHH